MYCVITKHTISQIKDKSCLDILTNLLTYSTHFYCIHTYTSGTISPDKSVHMSGQVLQSTLTITSPELQSILARPLSGLCGGGRGGRASF